MGHAAVDCVKWESSTVLIRCWLQQLLVFGMMIISFAVMFGAREAIAQVPAAAPAPAGGVVPPQVVETIVVYLQAAGLTEAATFLETAVRGNVVSLPSAAQGGATIFAPTNLALETSPPVTNSNQLIAYHVALGRYTVPALTAFPVGKQIPTLILNQHLLVTSNDPNNYMIDAQHVVLVDICSNITSATVSCYQVDGVFNATFWGPATSIVNRLQAALVISLQLLNQLQQLQHPLWYPKAPRLHLLLLHRLLQRHRQKGSLGLGESYLQLHLLLLLLT
jgi:hypothetical protein